MSIVCIAMPLSTAHDVITPSRDPDTSAGRGPLVRHVTPPPADLACMPGHGTSASRSGVRNAGLHAALASALHDAQPLRASDECAEALEGHLNPLVNSQCTRLSILLSHEAPVPLQSVICRAVCLALALDTEQHADFVLPGQSIGIMSNHLPEHGLPGAAQHAQVRHGNIARLV